MQFGHLELFVSNMSISKHFYQEVLGFEVTDSQSENLVWLQSGPIEILLRQGQPAQSSQKYEQAPQGIVLYTKNLTETKALLESQQLEFKGTVDSDKCLTFTDPDGNWFQLVNPHDH